MKNTVTILIISWLLGGVTPAIGNDATVAKSQKAIWLQNVQNGAKLFLGPNRDDYATMNTEPGNYIFVGDGSALEHDKSYKITTGGMYLYTTAQGNAGLYSTGDDDKSSWTIVKQKQQSTNTDNIIRHGDIILLRNVYWPTSYLYNDGKNYAASGDYPSKPREWKVDWELTKVQRAKMPDNRDIIHDVKYIDNRGGPASPAVKETITLSAEDEVGVKKTNSTEWSAGTSVTATIEQASVPGVTPGGSLAVTANASIGGEVAEEIGRVQKVTQGKSVEVTYDKPEDGEVLLNTRLSVPYQNFKLSYEGDEPIQMRSVNGAITSTGLIVISIPRRDKQGNIGVVPEAEVIDALDKLNRMDSELADMLRKNRLPEWKKAGWVGAASNGLVLAPGSEMNVKQKYWSENGQFYAIFQPDGNFGVSTKDDRYKWDIYTPNKADMKLGAKKLILQPDGNLVFYGPNDTLIWAIDKRISPVANSTLNINNSGVLLLVAPDGAVLWSSSK